MTSGKACDTFVLSDESNIKSRTAHGQLDLSHSPFSHTQFNFSGLGASASVKGNAYKVGHYSGNSLKARTAPGVDSSETAKDSITPPQHQSLVKPFSTTQPAQPVNRQPITLYHPSPRSSLQES